MSFVLSVLRRFADGGARRSSEERKVVSVLFCDLVGFTAASDAANPEDVRRASVPTTRACGARSSVTAARWRSSSATRYGGVRRAGRARGRRRATVSAVRILEAIAELNEAGPGALRCRSGSGSTPGEAVVRSARRPEEGEGIVTGDVVNTASRLQGAAPVDGIAVSEQTYRQTERSSTTSTWSRSR